MLAILCAPVAARGQAPAAPSPEVGAVRTDDPIHLDGNLDEPAWAGAGVIADLTQQEPRPGEPTAYRTEVRLLVDGDTLYLGFTCHDGDPAQIAVHTMQRDGDFNGDDTVAFVLDPFGDHRNGYLFRLNAAGARQDGLISQARETSLDWDGIWDARTRRTEDGWTAEVAIPAQTLRFSPGLSAWGFNVERFIARDRITLRFAGITHDSLLNDLRRAGSLSGMGEVKQGLGLSIAPYGLLRLNHDLEEDHSFTRGDAGVDVTWNITPELAAVATVNTDFAETEADTRQINLTRFPLFFPEKRGFFLEGSNLFDFSQGLDTDFIPFFSRRIGIFEESEVPINAGGKILGRTGPWGIAVLDVDTASTPEASGTNLFSGRLTYDLGEHLRFGAIATHGHPDGVHDNSLGGLDAVWQTATLFGDKNLAFSGWVARSSGMPCEEDATCETTRTVGGPDSPNGWGFRAAYPNDRWDFSVSVNQYGDALNPALGFLPRPGTRIYRGGAAFQPRPGENSPFRWARQFFFEIFPFLAEDLSGDPESWRVFFAPFNVETRNGEHLEANFAPQYERVDDPFEIGGVTIPKGEYRFNRFRVEMESSTHDPLRAGIIVWFGDFFGGRLSQWRPSVEYTTPAGHLQLALSAEEDFGHLPGGDFIERLLILKATYAFSPYLLLSFFSQYDSDCPEEAPPDARECRNLGFNSRLRWTLRPGNDLFVIWNRNWGGIAADGDAFALQPQEDQFAVKLRWTFRK